MGVVSESKKISEAQLVLYRHVSKLSLQRYVIMLK